MGRESQISEPQQAPNDSGSAPLWSDERVRAFVCSRHRVHQDCVGFFRTLWVFDICFGVSPRVRVQFFILCVCMCNLILRKRARELIIIPLVPWPPYAWLPPMSFVCRGDRPHTRAKTLAQTSSLFVLCTASTLLWCTHLFFLFLFWSFFSFPLFHFLASTTTLLPLSAHLSLSLFLSFHLVIILPSSLKAHPLPVWREIRMYICNDSLSPTKRIVPMRVWSSSFVVLMSVCVHFFFSMHALTNLCQVCVYIFKHVSICPQDAM